MRRSRLIVAPRRRRRRSGRRSRGAPKRPSRMRPRHWQGRRREHAPTQMQIRPRTSATTRAVPHAAASASGSSRPAAAPAPSARADTRSAKRRQRAGARERGDGDQARAGAPEAAVERCGQGADAQDEGESQRDGAIGADTAVAHDVELHRPRRAAAEAVGDVGEPILVQGAGRSDKRRRRQPGANDRGQADEPGRRQRQRADKADRPARDRRRPGEAIDVEGRARAGLADGRRVKKRSASPTSRAAGTKRRGPPNRLTSKARRGGAVEAAQATGGRRTFAAPLRSPRRRGRPPPPRVRSGRIRQDPTGERAPAPRPCRSRAAPGSGCRAAS